MGIADENMVSATFWANLTTERIYEAMDNAKAAAVRLQNFIIWVFGIFSTLTFTGVVFAKKEDWNASALLILGLALGMLVYAYWLSIKSTYPFAFSIQVGNEASEKKAYCDAIKEVRKYLSRSFRLCAAGTLFYAIGILVQFGYPLVLGFGEEGIQGLSVNAKDMREQQTMSLHVRSDKNSQVLLFLETDTVINRKKLTLPAFRQNDGLGIMVYVDESGSALVNLKYQMHNNIFLRAERTENLKNGGERKTFIRLKLFELPTKPIKTEKTKG